MIKVKIFYFLVSAEKKEKYKVRSRDGSQANIAFAMNFFCQKPTLSTFDHERKTFLVVSLDSISGCVCLLVRQSVGPLVRQSVGPLVRDTAQS